LRRSYASYFIIGHVGALSDRHKGQRHLIEAARRLEVNYPQMRFLFLGSGPDRKMLEGMAEGLNNVDFLGFQNDVGLYLSIMDLFVFPSNYEGLGSTLLDAIGCGVPIIASAVGGIPDIIQDGVNGVLIPPGNPQAITEAIVHLYHRPGLRRSLAHQAAARLDEFSPARMVHSYEHLYRSLNPQL
jgi:glycosyltransferase involved in cell wall biosynthesis